ncbi:WYL domain-containing protein [uncultured Treponema sp.]|uniref:WYL domain-containing protein n=1 Tax=uncultured Treponema sp. TaxID=162155 RepID=UPI0035A70419
MENAGHCTFCCGICEREWHKNQLVAQHEDGSVLLKFSSNQKQMVFSWAMGFGDSVTVIKPARLREEIREECRKMAGKYGTRES